MLLGYAIGQCSFVNNSLTKKVFRAKENVKLPQESYQVRALLFLGHSVYVYAETLSLDQFMKGIINKDTWNYRLLLV